MHFRWWWYFYLLIAISIITKYIHMLTVKCKGGGGCCTLTRQDDTRMVKPWFPSPSRQCPEQSCLPWRRHPHVRSGARAPRPGAVGQAAKCLGPWGPEASWVLTSSVTPIRDPPSRAVPAPNRYHFSFFVKRLKTFNKNRCPHFVK